MTTITIDRAVLLRALEALRPATAPNGAKRDAAFEELRAALAAPATAPQELAAEYERGRKAGITEVHDAMRDTPATAPERKPMHEGEIQAAWLGQDLDEPIPYTFVLGIRSAERFNGIKEQP